MSPTQSSANSNMSAALTKSMHDHWGLYLGEGIVLILLGLVDHPGPSSRDVATITLRHP